MARDDFTLVVESDTWQVDTEWLTYNDAHGGEVTVVIDDWPAAGTLTPSPGGFLYELDGPFYGVDSFTYRLVGPSGESEPATVTLNFVVARPPLAGRWPTPTCNEDSCEETCEDGQGVELGWYDRATQTFYLCDWDGGDILSPCGRYVVDRPVPGGGLPLVIDWDGDGWDEPALQSPRTGNVWLFEDSGAPCPGDCGYQGNCLELVSVASTGFVAEERAAAFAGRWSPSSPPQLGAYDAATGELHLAFDGQSFGSSLQFAVEAGVAAVPGDWLDQGLDSVGAWSRERYRFDYLVDGGGSGWGSFKPDLAESYLDRSWAFAARPNACQGGSNLAFYNPAEREVVMMPVAASLERGSTYVNVPTDPEGWPWMPQDCGEPEPDDGNGASLFP